MRIAVSGTHCSGKSTLIEDFTAAHRHYELVPEPYELLDESYSEPTVDDFHRQLEISVETVRGYPPGAFMIAERSPLDFIAYILALEDAPPAQRALDLAAAGMAHIDLLVVLPLDEEIEAPDAEDRALREAMNERLFSLIGTDEFDLLRNAGVRVVEVTGPPRRRLMELERAVRLQEEQT